MNNIKSIDNTDEKLVLPSMVGCWKKVWDKNGWAAWDVYRNLKIRIGFPLHREIHRKIREEKTNENLES